MSDIDRSTIFHDKKSSGSVSLSTTGGGASRIRFKTLRGGPLRDEGGLVWVDKNGDRVSTRKKKTKGTR
jgi:hypothetical protein